MPEPIEVPVENHTRRMVIDADSEHLFRRTDGSWRRCRLEDGPSGPVVMTLLDNDMWVAADRLILGLEPVVELSPN